MRQLKNGYVFKWEDGDIICTIWAATKKKAIWQLPAEILDLGHYNNIRRLNSQEPYRVLKIPGREIKQDKRQPKKYVKRRKA